ESGRAALQWPPLIPVVFFPVLSMCRAEIARLVSFKLFFLRVLLRLAGLLSWRAVDALGGVFGFFLWHLRVRARQVTEINIELCLPELDPAERQRLARASIGDLGQTGLGLLKVWGTQPARVVAAVREVEGEAILQRAREPGRGVLVLAPHHGNWEVAGLYLGQRYGLTSMYLPGRDEALNQLVRDARSRSGAAVVPADNSGVRAILKSLKRGELIGVLPDQIPKQAGVELAPFFGHPALTMTLVSNLLQKTGARAVMATALRIAGGG